MATTWERSRSKERSFGFLCRPGSGSYRALSIVTMRGFPFRSAAFRYLLGNTSSRVMSKSFHCGCCLWEIAKVRGSGPDFSKLDRAPKRAAVGASRHSPKSIVVRWRPWLAVRAVAGDGAYNDHPRLPAPCRRASRAGRPWRPPPMLAPGELGAENQLVVGNFIACGGAFVYPGHSVILFLRA